MSSKKSQQLRVNREQRKFTNCRYKKGNDPKTWYDSLSEYPKYLKTWLFLCHNDPVIFLTANPELLFHLKMTEKHKNALLKEIMNDKEKCAYFMINQLFNGKNGEIFEQILWYHGLKDDLMQIRIGVKEAREKNLPLEWVNLQSKISNNDEKKQDDDDEKCIVCFDNPIYGDYATCSKCLMTKINEFHASGGKSVQPSLFADAGRKPIDKIDYGNFHLFGVFSQITMLLGSKENADNWLKGTSDTLLCQCTGHPDCREIVIGQKDACAEGGGIDGRCAKHPVKEFAVQCPDCGIRIQHNGGCRMMRCCFKGNGYHDCLHDQGLPCNHKKCDCDGDCDCPGIKGCGCQWNITEEEKAVGNDDFDYDDY